MNYHSDKLQVIWWTPHLIFAFSNFSLLFLPHNRKLFGLVSSMLPSPLRARHSLLLSVGWVFPNLFPISNTCRRNKWRIYWQIHHCYVFRWCSQEDNIFRVFTSIQKHFWGHTWQSEKPGGTLIRRDWQEEVIADLNRLYLVECLKIHFLVWYFTSSGENRNIFLSEN